MARAASNPKKARAASNPKKAHAASKPKKAPVTKISPCCYYTDDRDDEIIRKCLHEVIGERKGYQTRAKENTYARQAGAVAEHFHNRPVSSPKGFVLFSFRSASRITADFMNSFGGPHYDKIDFYMNFNLEGVLSVEQKACLPK